MSKPMNNDEILAALREQPKNDEFEKRENLFSTALSAAVSALLAAVMFFLQFFIKGTVNAAVLAIGATTVATQQLCEGIRAKKKKSLIIGIIFALAALLFICVFVAQLFSKVWMV